MQIRIVLLYGCYLVSSDAGAEVRCNGGSYAAHERILARHVPGLAGDVAAADFVRQSMRAFIGEDERDWPALARKFTGAAG
jgi:hypothetical protein